MTRINGAAAPRSSRATDAPPLGAGATHAVELPGGNLHRAVTAAEAGFMTPEHLALLDHLDDEVAELRERPVLVEGAYARADHEHPPAPLPEHVHEDYVDGIVELSDMIDELGKRIDALGTIDAGGYARVDHQHTEVPTHSHAELEGADKSTRDRTTRLEEQLDALWKDFNAEVEARQRVEATLAELTTQLSAFNENLAFTRELAEKSAKRRGSDHGNHGGGAQHQAATSSLAGFMTPEHLRRLDTLWERLEGAKPSPVPSAGG